MRKYRQEALICMAAVLFFNTALFAANIIYDQGNVDTSKSDIHAHDYDIGNGRNQIILADDWLQDDSIPFNTVSDTHWFGSVENDDPHSTMCVGFHLSIHTELQGACVPADPPVWEKEVPLSHITITDTGLTNSSGEKIYRYDYYLDPAEYVTLTVGQKYWFDVSANSVDLTVPFKWKWANAAPPIAYCPAAQKVVDGLPDPWTSLDNTDLAFIITADEPPQITPAGQLFQQSTFSSALYVNLLSGEVSNPILLSPGTGTTVTATLTLAVHNNGTERAGSSFEVAFYRDSNLTDLIGTDTVPGPGADFPGMTGCGTRHINVTVDWPGLPAGEHPFWVKIDYLDEIGESDEGDNVASGIVSVNALGIYLPIINRSK